MESLLVTGASGHLGQRVLHHLLDALGVPAGRVVAATRKPDALAAFAARGVSVRTADLDEPASLDAAFRDVGRLLLISTDGLGTRLRQHEAGIAAAERAGVSHVVYTSMPRPEGSPALLAPSHLGTEKALAASRLPGWTVLRNNWYAENLFMWAQQALATGEWVTAAGDGRIAYIPRDDLALAAATALVSGGDRRTLTLSGPHAWSADELAARVSETAGRSIRVVHVTADVLVAGLVGAGLPEPVARLFASLDAHTAAGGLAEVSGDYKVLTGRDPQALEAWLAANRGAFASSRAA